MELNINCLRTEETQPKPTRTGCRLQLSPQHLLQLRRRKPPAIYGMSAFHSSAVAAALPRSGAPIHFGQILG